MILAGVLFSVGMADFARQADPRSPAPRLLRALILAMGSGGLFSWLVSGEFATAIWVIGLAFAWLVLTQFKRTWAVALAAAVPAVVVLYLFQGTIPAASPIGAWWQGVSVPSLQSIPVERVVLAVGLAVALMNSANIFVQMATSYLPRPPREAGTTPADASTIKGGRYLGPIERIAILGLVASGNLGGVAVVVAAKSVIRFSEINSSNSRTFDAEYYLVGSGLSWLAAVAGGAAILIR
jgi:hypothetical protein